MKILLDMNLSPRWVEVLTGVGFQAVHWSTVGSPTATDRTIVAWALQGGWVVFTHDLDFSRILALTSASGPSVVQLRSHSVLPDSDAETVLASLAQHAAELERGAIVVVDLDVSRVRLLPLQ